MIRSDKYLFLKYGSYALLMLGFFLLQSSRGTAISLWGAAVDALPFFVAAVALLDGPYAGGAFGFAAGVLTIPSHEAHFLHSLLPGLQCPNLIE